MNRVCNARPYEGDEPYAYISYSESDAGRVYPVLEVLRREGYRFWYAESGTDRSVIEEKLHRCSYFISFFSANYVNYHDGIREHNISVLRKLSMLTVLLDDISLSVATTAQLSRLNTVSRFAYDDFNVYIGHILHQEIPECVKGEPDYTIKVSAEDNHHEEKSHNSDLFDWFAGRRMDDRITHTGYVMPSEEHTVYNRLSEEHTVYNPLTMMDMPADIPKAEFIFHVELTGERVYLTHNDFKFGRSPSCDCVLNDRTISRIHMIANIENHHCYILDNQSTNHVFVNDRVLPSNTKTEVFPGDEIRLCKTKIIVEKGNMM